MIKKIRVFADIHVEIATNRNDFICHLKKLGVVEEIPENLRGRAVWLENKTSAMFIIGLFCGDYPTAIHESVHIVDYIGEYFNIQDKEFRAYMTEYIAREAMAILNKTEKKAAKGGEANR